MSSLSCAEYRACDAKISSKAIFYCLQCHSLQCILCEKQIHQNSDNKNHERLNLDEINNEYCSIDKRHPAIFYCPTCVSSFCYACYVEQPQHSNGREHKPQKYREEQLPTTEKNNVQNRIAAKPIYPDLSSNVFNNNSNKQNKCTIASAPLFEDIQLDDHNKHNIPPSDQHTSPKQTKTSAATTSHQQQNAHHVPQRENINEDILETDSNGVVLLLNANEHLTVNNEFDFMRQLKSSSQDPTVKCVSIIGNTGDGKSFTLNQIFFDGQEKFDTSSTAESCTMGVWAALDENQKTLVLDTEGRLGLSQNDNIRNRLLLKILCISDVVIFRTRAPKLPNDMFQFLSDASTAFLKYFRKELENVMKNCKVDGPMSTMGPTLIVFHETQYTEVLRDHLQRRKTAVEQLKERFEKMKLTYDAYSSIEYVGIQTLDGKQTDFTEIKATVTAILENNKIRSPRRLSIIFRALKALNEKFNHAIPPEMPSTLPDDFFTCCIRCLSCGAKCNLAANHQKENIPHQCNEQCSYNKELDNEIMKCLKCDREGHHIIVYEKLIATDDSLVQGIVKYVWSGFVIQCPKHGEIYRSRRYWFGNNEPKDVTRVEVIHVWPGEDNSRLASDVTPRKVIEVIRTAGSYLSAPTKMLTEKIADQVAPSNWIPNRDVQECSSCKLQFGSDYSKHHCRACGCIFCDTCTTHRAIVPLLDNKTRQRVCDVCYHKLQSQTLSSIFTSYTQPNHLTEYETNNSNGSTSHDSFVPNSYNIPMTRRFLELVSNNVAPVVYNYPIELIKERTRPNYWRPDNECLACFICKHSFNNTTHRLHHCRKCGDGVCDLCSPNKRCVPERDWLTPERVCKLCDQAMNESNSECK